MKREASIFLKISFQIQLTFVWFCVFDIYIILAYQPTLFEMMGIPKRGDKSNLNGDSEVKDSKEDGYDGIFIEEQSSFGVEENCNDDHNNPSEYITKREYDDKIYRLEWINDGRNMVDRKQRYTDGW